MLKIINSSTVLASIKKDATKSISIKIKPLIILIGKLALGIFLVPIFFSKYRRWVDRSITQVHSDTPKKDMDKCVKAFVKFSPPSPTNSTLLPDVWRTKLRVSEHDSLLNLSEEARIKRAKEDKQIYKAELATLDSNHIAKKHPLMGHINWIPGHFSLWMAGVSLVASYLAEKHHIKGLYVCNTVEAMSQKLDEVLGNTLNQRVAFVIPTIAAGSYGFGFKPNFPQHKIAVFVEKNAQGTKIAILDADVQTRVISAANLPCDTIWDGWVRNGSFNPCELALRAIFKANLPASTEVFYSHVSRESKYGCESFALRDALAFLKDPNFFDRLQGDQEFIYQGVKVSGLNQLPPAFMISTQYFSALKLYLNRFPRDQKIPGSSKTLQEYVNKYRFKVAGKEQNHYITRKTYKYSRIALTMLQKMKSSDLEAVLNQTFLT